MFHVSYACFIFTSWLLGAFGLRTVHIQSPGPPTTDRPPDLPLEMPLESSPNYSESLRDRMLKRPESDNFEHRQVITWYR